jgi:N-acetylglucosamine-6-phosphate deacetylase
MASQMPAQAVGLSDAGEIRVGAGADLVLLNDSGQLLATMRRGKWVGTPPRGKTTWEKRKPV